MEVKSENVGNDEGISRYVYCHVHTPAKSRPPISNASWKRLINNKIKEGRKYVLNFAREAPQISVPVIPQNKYIYLYIFLILFKFLELMKLKRN